MSATVTDIEAAAMRLLPELRARLAVKLIESLDGSQDLSREEVERVWLEEAEERLRQLETGEVEPVPAERVLADARNALR